MMNQKVKMKIPKKILRKKKFKNIYQIYKIKDILKNINVNGKLYFKYFKQINFKKSFFEEFI